MTMTPEIDVAGYLSNVVSGLTQNTNLWYGGILQADPDNGVPHEAVFVTCTGGAAPLAIAGFDADSENYATIQIFVRGNKNDYPDAMTLARAIWTALRYASLPGYIECRPLQSGPIYLGLDKDGHHAISINYELVYNE